MLERRRCNRCDGTERKVLDGVAIDGWRPTPDGDGHWFCPTCDWGSDPAPGEEILY